MVIAVLEKIPPARRRTVREITIDLSSSMMLIARRSFPKATVTNDRFHVHKLYYDAIDELRISLRWMARDKDNEEIARFAGRAYTMCRSSMQTAIRANSCWPVLNT